MGHGHDEQRRLRGRWLHALRHVHSHGVGSEYACRHVHTHLCHGGLRPAAGRRTSRPDIHQASVVLTRAAVPGYWPSSEITRGTTESVATDICSPVARFFTPIEPASISRSPATSAIRAPERSAARIDPLSPRSP